MMLWAVSRKWHSRWCGAKQHPATGLRALDNDSRAVLLAHRLEDLSSSDVVVCSTSAILNGFVRQAEVEYKTILVK